jgi:hypothetical protein
MGERSASFMRPAEPGSSPGVLLLSLSKEKTVDKQQANGAADKMKETVESLASLKQASRDLKERIIDQKRRSDLPIDSTLGNPEEEARNADGRNDLHDIEDD